ncbi:phenylacetate--CoA ligase family protein [Thiocystis violacea]|uniref:phenylacetate--CoA ligase family protein n=1 Tax=Thiocystis violacea TaxID=13725 RepID=UPI0019050CF6|nr:AMP-binding protein [Thiocystis violacea]MBK1724693.1 capsule biosynthesis protein CapK [Thiocystis violacea]
MTDFYTRLVSEFIFPLHERLKRHDTVRIRREMEQSQWWSPERLESLRLERLRTLLISANAYVPYYRDLFAQIGFDPTIIDEITDLQALPFLTKAEIRANTDALRAENAVGLARFNTGGSTGEPLIFYIGRERVSHDVAAKWRATRWWDVDIGDPEIVLWGSPIELSSQDRLRQLRDRLMRTTLLPAFEMSPAKVRAFLETIHRVRPKMLFGYPSAFAHLATQAEAQGLTMNDRGIKVAFVTSERLYDHQRAQIERIFGCPVANGYGGRDAGFIAHQCPAGGMHLTHEDIIVEIVDPYGYPVATGEAGEIVVTHLATRSFPFIRYRTGDIGIIDDRPCACRRTLPLLKEVQGRSTDFLIAADGTVLHGLSIIYILRDLPGIQQFKIVQEDRSLTRILLVTDAAFDDMIIETVRADVRARLGASIDVIIERVDSIPADASGKFRYVVSHAS